MCGLNAVAIVLFGCINVLAYKLCKCPENIRKKTVNLLCSVLLSINVFRYSFVYPFIKGEGIIPIEFSAVAYFAVPIILLFSEKLLHTGRHIRV